MPLVVIAIDVIEEEEREWAITIRQRNPRLR